MNKKFQQLSLFNYKIEKIKSQTPPSKAPIPQEDVPPIAPPNNIELQSLTTATEELQKRIKAIENNSQTSIAGLSTTCAQNTSTITALNDNVSTLQSTAAQHASNISTLNANLGTAQTNISTLQTQVGALESANATNQTNVANNASAISTLSSSISQHATDISTNAGNISNLSSRLTSCETAISQMGGSGGGSSGNELFTIPNVTFSPVYSVYDTFSRDYIYALTALNRTQKIFFLVDKYTTFHIDLSITFSALSHSAPQYLQLYLDGQLVDTKEYEISENQTLSFDFSLTHYSTTGYHYYYFLVSSGRPFTDYQHHLHSHATLYGKNALFISRKNIINSFPCPNGTYCLTRTVNGYGQYATFQSGTTPTNLTWADIPNSQNFHGASHSYLPYYTKDQNQNIINSANVLFYHSSDCRFKIYNYTAQSQLQSSDVFSFIGQSFFTYISSKPALACCTLDSSETGCANFIYPFNNASGFSLNKSNYTQYGMEIPQFIADISTPKDLVAFNEVDRPLIGIHMDQNGMLTALVNFPKPIRKQFAVQIDFGSQANAYFINDNCDIIMIYNQYNFIKKAVLTLDRTNWAYNIVSTEILGNAQEMRMGWGTDLFTINNEKIIKV